MNADVAKIVSLLSIGSPSVWENYILPGMRSTLIAKGESGAKMRIFEMQRDQETEVVPHNHRYNFSCYVIAGSVRNRVYNIYESGIDYASHVSARYDKDAKALDMGSLQYWRGTFKETPYEAGDWYNMRADEFHSIWFSKGSKVLFIEGADVAEDSSCLLPFSNGVVCNTFYSADWMMKPQA